MAAYSNSGSLARGRLAAALGAPAAARAGDALQGPPRVFHRFWSCSGHRQKRRNPAGGLWGAPKDGYRAGRGATRPSRRSPRAIGAPAHRSFATALMPIAKLPCFKHKPSAPNKTLSRHEVVLVEGERSWQAFLGIQRLAMFGSHYPIAADQYHRTPL